MSLDDESIFEDNDDDVFNSSNKPTPSYSNSGQGGVPGYLRSALERYISENPQIKNSYTSFKEEKSALTEFISVFTLFDGMLIKIPPAKSHGAVTRTLLAVLDEATEGRVQRCYNAFQFEPNLISMHLNLSLVSDVHTALLESGKELTEVTQLAFVYLTNLAEIYSFCIKKMSERYIEACQLANLNPDLGIIEHGIRIESDFAFAMGSRTTQILSHFRYGDVAEVSALYEASTRRSFVKYFVPLLLDYSSDKVEAVKAHVAAET